MTQPIHLTQHQTCHFRTPTPKYQLLGNAESRAAMYRERLLFTQQRLLRSELFTLKGLGNSAPLRGGAGNNNAVHEVGCILC